MVLKLVRTSKFSSLRLRGLEVHFSCIRSHIGFTYSDFTVLNLDIEIVNLVSLGSHVLFFQKLQTDTKFDSAGQARAQLLESVVLNVSVNVAHNNMVAANGG